jgi:heme-degrading monooxygenase HmoA
VYARSTTIHAQLSSIDTGIAHVRDVVMPALAALDGWIGLSLLVNRQSGRCIITTAWQSEEALATSAPWVLALRDHAVQKFAGSQMTIDNWEIAVLHRDHRTQEGCCARATWGQGDPARVDSNLELYKSSVLPDLDKLEGFCSASLLIDRASGRGVSCTTFDSREAMERNRAQARAQTDQATRELDVTMLEESEFDLAIAHLRVPELV